MEDFDALIIAEDSASHRVNYLWQYSFPNAPGTGSPVGGSLTPFFAANLGAEMTSVFWHNLGVGVGYLTAVRTRRRTQLSKPTLMPAPQRTPRPPRRPHSVLL